MNTSKKAPSIVVPVVSPEWEEHQVHAPSIIPSVQRTHRSYRNSGRPMFESNVQMQNGGSVVKFSVNMAWLSGLINIRSDDVERINTAITDLVKSVMSYTNFSEIKIALVPGKWSLKAYIHDVEGVHTYDLLNDLRDAHSLIQKALRNV
jgi:hypothetical protein